MNIRVGDCVLGAVPKPMFQSKNYWLLWKVVQYCVICFSVEITEKSIEVAALMVSKEK